MLWVWTVLGAFHPGVIDAGTDIVNRLALGELEGKGKELTDETLLDNLLGGEARLMLSHLNHDLCQFGGGLAFAYLGKIVGDVLLINIYREFVHLGEGLFLGGFSVEHLLSKLVAIEDLLGFRGVGKYLVVTSVDGDVYVGHSAIINGESMKSKRIVNACP